MGIIFSKLFGSPHYDEESDFEYEKSDVNAQNQIASNEILPNDNHSALKQLAKHSDNELTSNAIKLNNTTIEPNSSLEFNVANESKSSENVLTKPVIPLTSATADNFPAADKQTSAAASNSHPEWLHEEFLSEILQQNIANFASIKKLQILDANEGGENFFSALHKIQLTICLTDNSLQDCSFLLKLQPSSPMVNYTGQMFQTFARETLMYNEILPAFEKAYADANQSVTFAPKSLKLPTNAPHGNMLLLEDLTVHGFRNANRMLGLDMKPSMCVLQKMAQLHAASACYYAKMGSFSEILQTPHFRAEYKEGFLQNEAAMHKRCLQTMAQLKGSEEFIDKLRYYFANLFDLLNEDPKKNPSEFKVLNHGDCWTNNIMFQYNEQGEVQNTYFVDFQMAMYGTPAQDLYKFLMSSPMLDIRLCEFEFFIRYYHDQLLENLRLLKYDGVVPSLGQLHADLLAHGEYACYAVVCLLAISLMPPSKQICIDTLMTNSGILEKMFGNSQYVEQLQAVMPWLNDRGLLDFRVSSIKSELQLPAWLNENYFHDILVNISANYKQILQLNVNLSSKSKQNLGSALLKLEIVVENQDNSSSQLSFMLKISSAAKDSKDLAALRQIFDKEQDMYQLYIPEFEQLYRTAGLSSCFGAIPTTNLSSMGFATHNRLQGLDLAHVECVLKKLAQLHAVSAKRFELKGPFGELFQRDVCSKESIAFFENIKQVVSSTATEYAQAYQHSEQYFEKILYLLDNAKARLEELYSINPSGFNVLNHGSCWLSNVIFEPNESLQVLQANLLDFQCAKYGSPCLDLYHFLFSSVPAQLVVAHFDYFIRCYHEQLQQHLQLLNFAGSYPDLKELHALMLKYGNLGFYYTYSVAALAYLDASNDVSLNMFSSACEKARQLQKDCFGNEHFKNHATIIFPWLNARGSLDI